MSLSILNSVSALNAENSLSNTQMNLQKTLTQLSTGLRINSGADDAAGLSIATGMQANISALVQSQQNATTGVGLLQTADGGLSQTTALLNRAVTLATEAATSNITGTQGAALDTEFQSILSEINQIGQTTNFNGLNVFASNAPTSFTSTQASLTAGTTLTVGATTTISDATTGGTFKFTAATGNTIATLTAAVATAATDGTLSAGTTATIVGGHLVVGPNTGVTSLTASSNDAVLGAFTPVTTAANTNIVFISDGVSTGAANTQVVTTINPLSATALSLNASNLLTNASATSALTAISSAISTVSANRGDIGASVNRLQAASNVMANQVQNLQGASNAIQNADIGKTVANMAQFNILQATGMAALQQSNQAQQAVLKLLQ